MTQYKPPKEQIYCAQDVARIIGCEVKDVTLAFTWARGEFEYLKYECPLLNAKTRVIWERDLEAVIAMVKARGYTRYQWD